jgi:hypothetical protein
MKSLNVRRTGINLFLILLLVASPAMGEKYFISPNGNDHNSGTSAMAAWATISKVNEQDFNPGDNILFEGGCTFSGPLMLDADDCGNAEDPLIITSYGSGRAVIHGGNLHAVVCTGSSWLTIQNINVTGFGIKTGQLHGGIGISVKDADFVTIDQVETSGFRWAGLQIDNCRDARITRVYAHDNGYAGIRGETNLQRLYIGHCRTNHNPGDSTLDEISGSGIEIFNASDAIIEYCEAAYNGGDQLPDRGNGPVGIWICYSHHTIIQYCIAHHNTNSTGDGGGIDLDSECHNNIVQYNYCYENKNYGIQLWQWRGDQCIEKNVIRYNIFENVKANTAHTIWIGHNDGTPMGIRDNEFYNNLVINEGPVIGLSGKKITDLRFYNNIFITSNSTDFLIGAEESQGFIFKGNCYWSQDGKFSIYNKYSDLKQWADITGQENIDGKIVGLFADPLITLWDPGAPKLTDPTGLTQMTTFLLKKSSPCIDKGLDLEKLYHIDAGTHDLIGNPLPVGSSFDIGPVEYH